MQRPTNMAPAPFGERSSNCLGEKCFNAQPLGDRQPLGMKQQPISQKPVHHQQQPQRRPTQRSAPPKFAEPAAKAPPAVERPGRSRDTTAVRRPESGAVARAPSAAAEHRSRERSFEPSRGAPKQKPHRDRSSSGFKGPYKMERRAGGIAPNGNPQCWYAPGEQETDSHRLSQREKQVEFGKSSTGYKAYIKAVPKESRKGGHPETPDKRMKCSKRCFDGLIRAWRRQLHSFDPPEEKARIAEGQRRKGARALSEAAPSEGPRSVDGDAPEDKDPMRPVAWEDIEKLEMATPASWAEDASILDSPSTAARTIYMTPEGGASHIKRRLDMSGDLDGSDVGTPRNVTTPHFKGGSEVDPLSPCAMPSGAPPGTPPSPFSPWAPWAMDRRSFADALRSPAPTGGPVPDSRPLASEIRNKGQAPNGNAGPLTFGDAFRSGALRATVQSSPLRGAGWFAGPRGVLEDAPSYAAAAKVAQQVTMLTEETAIEPAGQSISMRAAPDEVPCVPNVSVAPDEEVYEDYDDELMEEDF